MGRPKGTVTWRRADFQSLSDAEKEIIRKHEREYWRERRDNASDARVDEWREQGKKAQAKYRDRQTPDEKRNRSLWAKYGITLADYNEMKKQQAGKCLLCPDDGRIRKLCVDHDHETGRIRGLLCRWHNTSLGWYENNREQIEAYVQSE